MKVATAPLPNLLNHWAEVTPRIRAAGHLLIVLDFDGTLVRIASRPNRVRLRPATRRVLLRAARNTNLSVAVVSGRRSSELRHFLNS